MSCPDVEVHSKNRAHMLPPLPMTICFWLYMVISRETDLKSAHRRVRSFGPDREGGNGPSACHLREPRFPRGPGPYDEYAAPQQRHTVMAASHLQA